MLHIVVGSDAGGRLLRIVSIFITLSKGPKSLLVDERGRLVPNETAASPAKDAGHYMHGITPHGQYRRPISAPRFFHLFVDHLSIPIPISLYPSIAQSEIMHLLPR
jgi:hypothetical protein